MNLSLLPSNATSLELAIEKTLRGFDGQAFRGSIFPVEANVSGLWDYKSCPPQYLPFLAWALGVEVWDSSWIARDQEAIRRLIQNWLTIRRFRGTLKSMRLAFKSIGLDLEIKEWFDEEDREPYTFEVILKNNEIGDVILPQDNKVLKDIIEKLKPLRSRYGIKVLYRVEGRSYITGLVSSIHFHEFDMILQGS